MLRPAVLATNPLLPPARELLEEHFTLIENPGPNPWGQDELVRRCESVFGLLAFMTDRIDAGFLRRAPGLRVIACAFKGYDNIDLAACTEAGVWVTVVEDLLTVPTAELAVGLAIAVGRNVIPGNDLVKAGRFSGWRAHLYGKGLAGSCVSIAGVGRVGGAIARMVAGFAPSALRLYDREAPRLPDLPGIDVRRVDDRALFAEADFLFLALPLSEATRHFVDRHRLEWMKREAVLINVGRGSVVDESAIATALADGRLGGYAADVFSMEDWSEPNRPASIPSGLRDSHAGTVLTPHLGSAVRSVRERIELAAASSVVAVKDGRTPPGALNRPSATAPARAAEGA